MWGESHAFLPRSPTVGLRTSYYLLSTKKPRNWGLSKAIHRDKDTRTVYHTFSLGCGVIVLLGLATVWLAPSCSLPFPFPTDKVSILQIRTFCFGYTDYWTSQLGPRDSGTGHDVTVLCLLPGISQGLPGILRAALWFWWSTVLLLYTFSQPPPTCF